MYVFQWKTKFKRDFKLIPRRGWDVSKLEVAFRHLADTGTLPDSYKPHPLRGDYKGCIDAHIQPDWVLIYEVLEDEKVILLHRTGRHQDVFSGY